MPSPGRALARLLIAIGAVATSLFVGVALLLVVSETMSTDGFRRHWCWTAPASVFDWAIHSSTFGVWLLFLGPLLIALWTANRERATGAELRSIIQAARMRILPRRAAAAAHAVGVATVLDLVDAPQPFAFVYGWAHPRICVSTGLVGHLTERELEAVLLHERWHFVRRDPVRLLVVRMLSAAFLFLPGIRRLSRQYRLATEIAADHHAVVAMGSQRWLASALAKLTVPDTAPPAGVVAFVGLVDARIAALAGEHPHETSRYHRIAGLVLLGELLVIATLITQHGRELSPSLWINPFC